MPGSVHACWFVGSIPSHHERLLRAARDWLSATLQCHPHAPVDPYWRSHTRAVILSTIGYKYRTLGLITQQPCYGLQ